MGKDTLQQATSRTIADDLEVVDRIGAVPSILEMVCRSTGLRFAAVARVTEDRWVACAVHDELDFGLVKGGELPIRSTLCDEILGNRSAIIINHVSEDPVYCNHHTPRTYGFESYISMPILRANGEFFGTLCALDPRPISVSDAKTVTTFQILSQLIGMQLDAEERLRKSEKALMEEQQTAELREQFIAVLGHDLRNPLFSIVAGTEVLSKMPLTERATAIVNRMRRSGDRITALVDNILDFARGRLGGGLPITLQPVTDLEKVLGHVVAEILAAQPDCQVGLDLNIGQTVDCDAARIAQLLSNLVSNALAHGEVGILVDVVGRCEGGQFMLSVSNQGPPIPHETMELLFRPFTRFSGDKGKQGGLGLGLYIASEIAAAHHGRLSVSSEAGRTRFTFSMPVSASK